MTETPGLQTVFLETQTHMRRQLQEPASCPVTPKKRQLRMSLKESGSGMKNNRTWKEEGEDEGSLSKYNATMKGIQL